MTTQARVLVVDDDPVVAKSIDRVLTGKGYAVITASDGPEALDKLAHGKYDAVFTDIRMPGMDGFELIQRVRTLTNEKKDIPAAALTAYARSEDRARALRTGFEMHLAKPIDPSELIAAVVSLARRRSGATRES